MKRTLLIAFILSAFVNLVSAQDFPSWSVSNDELNMKTYDKDTSAHAVMLHEFGKGQIALVTNDNDIRVVFEYHVKIKIFDAKGFDNGTVQLFGYNYKGDPESYEKIDEIEGATYYKDDNGQTQKVSLDASNIYPVKEGNTLMTYKFTMPGIRNGCVIEYKYRLTTPYLDNFIPWSFQGKIPCMYSEFEAHIPAYFRYNISKKGNLKLTKMTSKVEPKCMMTNTGGLVEQEGADCSVFNYAIADVPALVEEEYMTAPKNFKTGINFQLTDYTEPYNMNNAPVVIKVAKTWDDVDRDLRGYFNFGGQLKKKSVLKDRIVPVIAGKTDDLSKANAIYNYIQGLFKWDGVKGSYPEYGISKAVETHTGNDADINFALYSALSAASFNTSVVLISTRDHGTINALYPDLHDYNYVVTRVDIDGQTYLLDATDPLLSFGMLPMRCLNDKGRVFSLDKPSYFMDINLTQKAKTTRTLDFTLQEDGTLKGTAIIYSTGYDAYKKRAAIRKLNSVDEYVEDFNSKSPKVKVLKSEITNIDSLGQPLIEKYDLEINIADKLGSKGLVFNPFFWDRVEVNPFKLADRSYPVDLGMASDQRLSLTVHLPDQYVVDTAPQAVAISMPGNAAKFITDYQPGAGTFTFSNLTQLNQPVYDTGQYPSLKELYNKIVQSEKAEIVFKKK